ncbi:MAG: hypothetical protein ABI619_00090 [Betaproteobacteria bacterium]
MNKTTKRPRTAAMLLAIACVAGCATPSKAPDLEAEKDISRVITLADGTTCVEPAGLAQSRQLPGAVQLKSLVDSDTNIDEALTKAKAMPLKVDEAEAVYFDACREYANAGIQKPAFDRYKTVYVALRQQLVTQGIKQWQEKKEGIADPGKLCLVRLADTDPDHRSFTRVVPEETTVNDCARLAVQNGSGEILLGCTKGHWENTWAKKPISVDPTERKPLALTAKGTDRAPEPDCGWT